mmetsp:Transcript_25024/g.62547  ORF Transcript_25024/g.62547 Transcript_25024/m.62547 type:complete len:435 (+) Transcript_25024:215-1519(+)
MWVTRPPIPLPQYPVLQRRRQDLPLATLSLARTRSARGGVRVEYTRPPPSPLHGGRCRGIPSPAPELFPALLVQRVPERAVEAVHRALHRRQLVRLLPRAPRPPGALLARVGIQFVQQLRHGGHRHGVEGVGARGIHGHAHPTGLGVDAERRLEEVVHVFGHLDVQSGIYVSKDNVVQAPSQRQRLWGIHALHHLDGLPYLGLQLDPARNTFVLPCRAHAPAGSPLRAHLIANLCHRDHRQHWLEVLCVLQQTLRREDGIGPEGSQHVGVCTLQRGVQRGGRRHALDRARRVCALIHGEILGDSGAALIGQLARALVADPAVDTAAPRVNPQQVLESKVVPQALIHNLDGNCHEGPALIADVGGGATRAHVVVVRHVDVEHQLALRWGKDRVGACAAAGVRQALLWVHVEHRAQVNLGRHLVSQRGAEILRVSE